MENKKLHSLLLCKVKVDTQRIGNDPGEITAKFFKFQYQFVYSNLIEKNINQCHSKVTLTREKCEAHVLKIIQTNSS